MANSFFDYFPRVGATSAREFPKGFKWLNVKKPLTLKELEGCIVILDFWTYCCINCMHMARVLEAVEEKYKGKPVVIIGVHSAKFEAESDPKNIEEAIHRYEIKHPVIVDKKLELWHTYGVNAWPTLIVIGPNGKVISRQPGEISVDNLDKYLSQVLQRYKNSGTLAKSAPKIEIVASKSKSILSYPGKIAFGSSGREFVLSDSNHNRILVVETRSGRILESIGNGRRGFEDGNFKSASFFRPQGVLWADKDTIFVCDTENHAIRKVDLESRKVERVAGTGRQAFNPSLDARDAKKADLSSPWDLAMLGSELYIAMAGLHQIWRYNLENGLISFYAGNGYENIADGELNRAEFAQPSGISIYDDTIYVADSEVSGIRSINMKANFVSTIVGVGLFEFGWRDGPLEYARMQHPLGIDAAGSKIYVADTYNSAIRRIDLNSRVVETVVGNKEQKSFCRFDDPHCDTLGLYQPSDVKLSGDMLYIADTNNNLVRTFDLRKMVLGTLKIRN